MVSPDFPIRYALYDIDPPLIVLGKGEIDKNPLRVECKGWIDKDGTYHLEFTYKINDPFDGVLSGGVPWFLQKLGETYNSRTAYALAGLILWYEDKYGELDFPFSKPYNMTVQWPTERDGRFY